MAQKTRTKLVDKVRRYVISKKASGGGRIGIFDLMAKFKQPPEKLNAAMETMVREGLVREEE